MAHLRERVGTVEEFRRGRVYGRLIGGVEIVLTRVGDEVFACSGVCSHGGAFLEMGKIVGHELHCPLHNGRFDMRTGEATHRPATYPIKSFEVAIKDGDVFVTVDIDVEDEAASA